MPLKIIRNDITKVAADIIVNSANPKPIYETGTDHAIYSAAGIDELLAERKKIGELLVGEIAVTPAFNLNAKYIIHTVGPIWFGGNSGELDYLKSCYRKSLDKAVELNCESIAFPLISTGVYMFPRDKALQVAMSTISEILFEYDMTVYLVVFDKKSFQLTGKVFTDVDDYIDDDSVFESQGEEYRAILERVDPERREEAMHFIRNADDASRQAVIRRVFGRRNQTKSLDEMIDTSELNFHDKLLSLIDERGMTDPEVYKKANLDRKLFSKIRCTQDYKPRKKTAVALALALELEFDEMVDLLMRAGIAFSPSSKFDKIVEYFVKNGIYDVQTINLSLFEHGEDTLGA
ncbi:MAG: macro domain-containing protein [Eubacterium sp.]|nr:macro domain-containing protein [Eubacterium sp.]